MQLAGTQLTNTSALAGNDVATFPDFPAEIRAPRGTLAGVSGFQIHFASEDIFTPGDNLNALVAMNPAALKTNLGDLEPGGILVVNEDSFDKKGLEQAGYETSPLEDDSLEGYRLFKVAMTKITRNSVEGLGLSQKRLIAAETFSPWDSSTGCSVVASIPPYALSRVNSERSRPSRTRTCERCEPVETMVKRRMRLSVATRWIEPSSRPVPTEI